MTFEVSTCVREARAPLCLLQRKERASKQAESEQVEETHYRGEQRRITDKSESFQQAQKAGLTQDKGSYAGIETWETKCRQDTIV